MRMTGDVSPILDRHVQERLGRMLKERLCLNETPSSSPELETLLANLRAAETGHDDPRSGRR